MNFFRSVAVMLFAIFRRRRERSELADARRYVAFGRCVLQRVLR